MENKHVLRRKYVNRKVKERRISISDRKKMLKLWKEAKLKFK